MSSHRRNCSIESLEERIFLSLTPTLSGNVPGGSLVAGQKIPAIGQIVHITNNGPAVVKGATTIALQLSPDASETSNAIGVISVLRHLKLNVGKSIAVPLGIRLLPAGLTGTLFVIASVTEPGGLNDFATSAGSINVVAPEINLAPIAVSIPADSRPGRRGISRVTIANTGNIAAAGALAVDLQASVSGAIDSGSIDLGLITRRVTIRPGKKITLGLAATLPSTGGPFFIVANVDPSNSFDETTLADNQLASATTILGQTETTRINKGAITVKLTRVATVPGADGTPQDAVTAPGVAGAQFVTTRNGDVLMLSGGTLSATPFLNFADAGISIYTGGEGGLLDIAFSPTFSQPGTFGFEKFYTFDTEAFDSSGPAADFSSPELFPSTGVVPNNTIVIREWTVSSPSSTVANLTSRVLMRIDHPQANHQGGALRFGPDGDLYIGLGDGGGANDENGAANDPTDGHTNAGGNAQDPNVVFGKILRINPDPAAEKGFIASANQQYSIPVSNPFAAGGGLMEIYAMGLRNPYRMSFDSATGKLYVGNVGQNNIESVDILTAGGNYGWPFFEGTRNNQSDTGRSAPVGFTFTTPIAEYTHDDGSAIIGGEVVRSSASPTLNGLYIFGDLASPASGGTVGRIFYMPATGGTIAEFKYDPSGLSPSANLFGFGSDDSGDVDAFFSNGDILALSAGDKP